MSEVLEGLNDLLQLDHDSVAGYEAARERLENAHHRLQIESFQRDHERHIRELNALILELGGTPRNEPHVTSPLREAIQRLSGAGGDRAILTAWRASELQASRRYDSYSRKALHWPSTAKLLVDQNALDEERHYRWVVDVLDRKRGRGLSAARLREKAAAGIDTVAAGLGRLAGAAKGTGAEAKAGSTARATGNALSEAAAALRSPESFSPRGLIEEEIRSHPARSLGITFAIGFLIGRLLR